MKHHLSHDLPYIFHFYRAPPLANNIYKIKNAAVLLQDNLEIIKIM